MAVLGAPVFPHGNLAFFVAIFSEMTRLSAGVGLRIHSIHPSITRESKWRYIMKKINLRELYPDVYKTQCQVLLQFWETSLLREWTWCAFTIPVAAPDWSTACVRCAASWPGGNRAVGVDRQRTGQAPGHECCRVCRAGVVPGFWAVNLSCRNDIVRETVRWEGGFSQFFTNSYYTWRDEWSIM